jgi:hypothetical protein
VPAESLIIPHAAASVLKVALPTSMHTEGVWEVKVVGQQQQNKAALKKISQVLLIRQFRIHHIS